LGNILRKLGFGVSCCQGLSTSAQSKKWQMEGGALCAVPLEGGGKSEEWLFTLRILQKTGWTGAAFKKEARGCRGREVAKSLAGNKKKRPAVQKDSGEKNEKKQENGG